MATRYKLIKKDLLDRLLQKDGMDDAMSDAHASRILKQNMPDDAKILLYGAASRDVHVKQAKKREAPLYIKKEEEEAKIDTLPLMLGSPKALELYEHLRSNNIGSNEKSELVINGTAVPRTNLPLIIKALIDSRMGYQPGMQRVLKELPTMPTMISKSVLTKYGYTPPIMPPPEQKQRTPSTVNKPKKVIAKRPKSQFGTGRIRLKRRSSLLRQRMQIKSPNKKKMQPVLLLKNTKRGSKLMPIWNT